MPTNHFAAGALAACLTTSLLHPLDSIKVRFQVNESSNQSTFRSLLHISKHEGPRALYLGLLPALLANGMSWGSYFFFYEQCKLLFGTSVPGHLTSGVASGAATVLLTNPVWLIKTRMQLQPVTHSLPQTPWAISRTIFQHEGLPGFYRGIIPALLLTVHGAIQFSIYEELKLLHSGNPDPSSFFIMGGLSKACATAITYPIQLVKTRMQQQGASQHRAYYHTLTTMKYIAAHEGKLGFYKGLGANLLKVSPQSAIMFALYETILKLL